MGVEYFLSIVPYFSQIIQISSKDTYIITFVTLAPFTVMSIDCEMMACVNPKSTKNINATKMNTKTFISTKTIVAFIFGSLGCKMLRNL